MCPKKPKRHVKRSVSYATEGTNVTVLTRCAFHQLARWSSGNGLCYQFVGHGFDSRKHRHIFLVFFCWCTPFPYPYLSPKTELIITKVWEIVSKQLWFTGKFVVGQVTVKRRTVCVHCQAGQSRVQLLVSNLL